MGRDVSAASGYADCGAATLAFVAIMDSGSLGTSVVAGSLFGLGLVPVFLGSWLAAVWLQDHLAEHSLLDGLHLGRHRFPGRHPPSGWSRHHPWGTLRRERRFADAHRDAEFQGDNFMAILIFPWLGSFLFYHRDRHSLLQGIAALLLLLGICFLVELLLPAGTPSQTFPLNPGDLSAVYIILVIFRTTVQPLALYLRAATGQNRGPEHRRATRVAFGYRLAINLAVFWLAVTLFYPRRLAVAGWPAAAHTLEPLLGVAAPTAFALALTVSGLAAAAVTGSLATLSGLAHLLDKPALLAPAPRLLFLPFLAVPLLLFGQPMAFPIASQALVGLGTPFLLAPVIYRRLIR